MSRKLRFGALIFAALLLAAFIWMRIAVEGRDGPDPSAKEGPETARDQQTKSAVSSTIDAAEAENSDNGSGETADSALVEAAEDSPYSFTKWEDVADHLAELVAKEYDALLLNPPFKYNNPIALIAPAFENVMSRVVDNQEDPALFEAIKFYLPLTGATDETQPPHRMPISEQDPLKFMIRAGRLSPDVLKVRRRLPNGEIYMADKHEEVIVTYKVEVPMSAERQAMIANLEEKVIALEKRTSANPGDPQLQAELNSYRGDLEYLKGSIYTTYESGSGPMNKDHPKYRVTRIDLGVIQPK